MELKPKYGRAIHEIRLGEECSSREEADEEESDEDFLIERVPYAPPFLRGFYFHHSNCEVLELSYRHGCQLCTMLWHDIMQPGGGGPKAPATLWAWETASPLLPTAGLKKNESWEPYP